MDSSRPLIEKSAKKASIMVVNVHGPVQEYATEDDDDERSLHERLQAEFNDDDDLNTSGDDVDVGLETDRVLERNQHPHKPDLGTR